jgi:hypothetical protein
MPLLKADGMFPKGAGAPRAFARGDAAAEKTNELLENALLAAKKLFEQRSYNSREPGPRSRRSSGTCPRACRRAA